MNYKERLIGFQNRAEQRFEKEKSFRNFMAYVAAFTIFFFSTFIAGLSMPFRVLYKKSRATAEPTAVSENNISGILAQHELVLLDFWAEWCGPCVMMESTLTRFSAQHKGTVYVAKVNVDQNKALAKSYGIRGIPQFVLLRQGKEIKRNAGPMTYVELESFIS